MLDDHIKPRLIQFRFLMPGFQNRPILTDIMINAVNQMIARYQPDWDSIRLRF